MATDTADVSSAVWHGSYFTVTWRGSFTEAISPPTRQDLRRAWHSSRGLLEALEKRYVASLERGDYLVTGQGLEVYVPSSIWNRDYWRGVQLARASGSITKNSWHDPSMSWREARLFQSPLPVRRIRRGA